LAVKFGKRHREKKGECSRGGRNNLAAQAATFEKGNEEVDLRWGEKTTTSFTKGEGASPPMRKKRSFHN